MNEIKPQRPALSATERMEAARRARNNRVEEEIMLLAWLTRYLIRAGCPVHLNPLGRDVSNERSTMNYVVCVHSSKGQLTWRISDLEAVAYFKHLKKEKCRWDGHTRNEKLNRIQELLDQMDGAK